MVKILKNLNNLLIVVFVILCLITGSIAFKLGYKEGFADSCMIECFTEDNYLWNDTSCPTYYEFYRCKSVCEKLSNITILHW